MLIPLLLVIALAVGVYIFLRIKEPAAAGKVKDAAIAAGAAVLALAAAFWDGIRAVIGG